MVLQIDWAKGPCSDDTEMKMRANTMVLQIDRAKGPCSDVTELSGENPFELNVKERLFI